MSVARGLGPGRQGKNTHNLISIRLLRDSRPKQRFHEFSLRSPKNGPRVPLLEALDNERGNFIGLLLRNEMTAIADQSEIHS